MGRIRSPSVSLLAAVCATLLAAVAPKPVIASGQPGAGHWEGRIDAPDGPLSVAVDLVPARDGWEGWIDIPLQGLSRFPLGEIAVENRQVTFALLGLPGAPVFRGTVGGDGTTLAGTLSQSGGEFPFSLTRKGEAIAAVTASSSTVDARTAALLTGTWKGMLAFRNQLVKMSVTLATDQAGLLSGTLDMPSQGAVGLALSRVTYEDGSLEFSLDFAGASFRGRLVEASDTIRGVWTQGPDALPVDLVRGDAAGHGR